MMDFNEEEMERKSGSGGKGGREGGGRSWQVTIVLL